MIPRSTLQSKRALASAGNNLRNSKMFMEMCDGSFRCLLFFHEGFPFCIRQHFILDPFFSRPPLLCYRTSHRERRRYAVNFNGSADSHHFYELPKFSFQFEKGNAI